MSNGSHIQREAREKILRLLSDDEVAMVSTAETTRAPLEGEEFLDLEELGRGVLVALGSTPGMSHLLLRRSVHRDTWKRILEELR